MIIKPEFKVKVQPSDTKGMKGALNRMGKLYNHLSKKERDWICVYKSMGWSLTQIAFKLKRSKATISRELNRNCAPKNKTIYLPSEADKLARTRWSKSHKTIRLKNNKIRRYVEKYLKLYWSPELIAGRLKIEFPKCSISHEAIYQYIYNEKPELTCFLARKRKKRRKKNWYRKSKRCLIPNRIPISIRPSVIDARERFGDWESDTIVSRESKAALNILVERSTRYVKIAKLNRKTALETSNAIKKILGKLPEKARLSITYDNGSENVWHQKINETLNIQSYFCEPYHSWEKGTVENINGVIRRFFPKKTDFSEICNSELKYVERSLNSRPMKCLNFKTPQEVFKEELKQFS